MKLTISSILLSVVPTALYADGIASVVSVQQSYKEQVITSYVSECEQIEVPSYRYSGSGGNVIAGAIIGGLIGNQFGSGSGKDAMTALGAIVGAERASKERSGYRLETRCYDVPRQEYVYIPDGYNVTYSYNGRYHTFHTYKDYQPGDNIIIKN